MASIGIGIGVIGAVGAGFAMRTMLLGVPAVDFMTLILSTLLFRGLALVVRVVPASRAAKLPPTEALPRVAGVLAVARTGAGGDHFGRDLL